MLAGVDGQKVPMPINLDTINALYELRLTSFEMRHGSNPSPTRQPTSTTPKTSSSTKGRELFYKFFRGYTRKQWGDGPIQG